MRSNTRAIPVTEGEMVDGEIIPVTVTEMPPLAHPVISPLVMHLYVEQDANMDALESIVPPVQAFVKHTGISVGLLCSHGRLRAFNHAIYRVPSNLPRPAILIDFWAWPISRALDDGYSVLPTESMPSFVGGVPLHPGQSDAIRLSHIADVGGEYREAGDRSNLVRIDNIIVGCVLGPVLYVRFDLPHTEASTTQELMCKVLMAAAPHIADVGGHSMPHATISALQTLTKAFERLSISITNVNCGNVWARWVSSQVKRFNVLADMSREAEIEQMKNLEKTRESKERLEGIKEAIKGMATPSPDLFDTFIENVGIIRGAKFLSKTKDGIVVELGPITITHENKEYSMGSYKVNLRFGGDVLGVNILEAGGGKYIHPHISGTGTLCLGDTAAILREWFSMNAALGHFDVIVDYLIRALSTYTIGNAYAAIEHFSKGGEYYRAGKTESEKTPIIIPLPTPPTGPTPAGTTVALLDDQSDPIPPHLLLRASLLGSIPPRR